MTLGSTAVAREKAQEPTSEAAKPRRRVTRVAKYVAITGVTAAALLASFWIARRPAPPLYITVPVTRGTIKRTVTATGTVNPVMTIIIGSYVSGVIRDVYCDYNTRVKKGQLCARIDPRPYQAALAQAKGQLARDGAQLARDKLNLARYAVLVQQNSIPGSPTPIRRRSCTSSRAPCIGAVGVGAPTDFTVEAFPDRTFHGSIVQVRQAPQVGRDL